MQKQRADTLQNMGQDRYIIIPCGHCKTMVGGAEPALLIRL